LFERRSRFWRHLTTAAGNTRSYEDLLNSLIAERYLHGQIDQILDCGAGTGAMLCAWRRAMPKAELTAADLSTGMVRRAQDELRGEISGVAGDNEALPFRSDSYGLVSAAHTLEHSQNPCTALAEMARVLRPGGRLLLVVTRPGPVDSVCRLIFRYRSIPLTDILRWMWEAGLIPVNIRRFGKGLEICRWLGLAILARKAAEV
jgi:demethylmenaquinone methyltransferase/2-methoxy-6-polyprenyl-1,4-benzoquinol methylase